MAIISELMQSYDQSNTADIFVAEGIHTISPSDTPLQLLLPKIQVSEIKAQWVEDDLGALTTTLNEELDNSETEIDVVDGTIFEDTVDTVIRIDREYMLVTGVSTNTLTVATRPYGSTSAATHASGAVVHIVSQVEHEGADGKKAKARARTIPSNYVQTFSRTVEVSGIQEAIRKMGGVTSEIDYQIMIAMRQLSLELEKTLLMGVKSQVGDGSTAYRTMGGLFALVTQATSDSGGIDTTCIEADIKTIWEAGGVPRVILTTGKLAQDIASLYASRIQTDIMTTIGGVNVTSIINPLGIGPIAIIPHRLMNAGEYFVLDTARMALGYLRPFHMEPLAKDGDSEKRIIIGDYTLELMNATAHTSRYGLT
ncbi:MAG: DUF5309 family protein [Candidatus Poribacteria bacterium]